MLWLLLGQVAGSIPAHVLRLEEVLQGPCWVVEARVAAVSEWTEPGSSGVELKVELLRALAGPLLPGPLTTRHVEPWPSEGPDGKVEAPI
ncbi:MAG: hypothetical protein HY319_09830 [Armatimonadetes bacterium]|nr:hypothetical protein [Armatimonadota bacterium]